MNKKPYEAPVVKKVNLEIKNSVLGVCYSSTLSDPFADCRNALAACFHT